MGYSTGGNTLHRWLLYRAGDMCLVVSRSVVIVDSTSNCLVFGLGKEG
jgi:hypothetical protein